MLFCIPHPDAAYNANLLYFSPLYWPLIPWGIAFLRGRSKARTLRLLRYFALGTMGAAALRLILRATGIAEQHDESFALYALLLWSVIYLALRKVKQGDVKQGKGKQSKGKETK